MKILSLRIENFGKLSDLSYVFGPGLNTICSENGWGKTTLACFIKAMFYGMDKKGNQKNYAADRSRFVPWQGGVYGGSLMFEANGKQYRVLRTFGSTPESDRFELLDIKTGKNSKDFSSNLGEELFGVGKETFSLSTFFPQGMLEGNINDEVRAHLSGASNLVGDVEMKSRAVKKLKSLSRELNASSPKNYEIMAVENSIENGKAKLNELEEEKSALKQKACLLKEKLKLLSQEEEKTSQNILDFVSAQKTQIDLPKNDLPSQSPKASWKERIMVALPFLIVILAMASVVVALFVTGNMQANLWIVFVAASVLVLFLAAWLVFLHLKRKSQAQKRKEELDDQLKKLEEKKKSLEEEFNEIAEKERQKEQKIGEKAEIDKNLALCENSLMHIERQVCELMEQIDAAQINRQQMRSQKEEIDKKLLIVNSVIDFLEEAQVNVSSRYVLPMQQKFSSILNEISQEKSIKLDVDLNPNVDTFVGLKEKQFLSRGTQDLVEICKRFALVQSVFEKEKPFIVLDDPFINLDENILQNTLSLIENFAKDYQIIYFICHKSRQPKNG